MNKLRWFLAVSTALLTMVSPLASQERGNATDVKAMVQDALSYIKEVGTSKAFEDFNDPASARWHKKDIYVNCYKFDGTCACQGANKAIVGKQLLDLKFPDGQPHIRLMADLARTQGSGWTEYPWTHPQTKKIENKRTWVVKVPDYDGFIYAGYYK
jgi:cytochrome c